MVDVGHQYELKNNFRGQFDYLSAIYGVLVSKNNRGATPNHFRRWKICTVLLATAHNGLKSVNLGGITAVRERDWRTKLYEDARKFPLDPQRGNVRLVILFLQSFAVKAARRPRLIPEQIQIPVSLSIHQLNKSPEFIPTFLLRGPTDESS
ncbi:hypothetical protein R3P38DRAFT_2779470 [Favolaschia claudopus]|uniref:Uncharacterized protein n=1 Tax=Favolaschia claudopus TaxID=2862362 RepID=A0AAW0BD91_9AGAR